MSESSNMPMVSSPYPWQLDNFQQLADLYQQQKLPHALLLQGEAGLGKLRFAQSFSQFLLCEQVQANKSQLACGQCKSCHLFAAQTHPNILTVRLEEKAKQIKVDQIRVLVEFVAKTAQREGMKIIIIEPAEAMNINAANALLKSLEEPTPNTLIFLVSHASHRLLPTIRSRCQSVVMQKPDLNDAKQWLSTYVSDAPRADLLLSIANGNPLKARDLNENEYLDVLKQLAQFMQHAQQRNANAVNLAEQLSKQDPLNTVHALQQLLWVLIKAANGVAVPDTHPLSSFNSFQLDTSFSQKAYTMLEDIQQANAELLGTSNPNSQLLLEALFIRFQALLASVSA